MRKLFLQLLLILFAFELTGQDLPTIIPPAPEARKMIEYGVVPVSYNTGTVNIQVPLTTINFDNISFPIALSYNSNGVKVGEDGGNTGLKWMLSNGAGRITRIVKGRPDEDDAYINSGWLHHGGGNLDFTNLTLEQKALVEQGCFDLEPDEYLFSLPNGFSGKFVFDTSAQIMMIPQTEEVNISYTFDLNALSWQIVDAEGVQYNFTTFETGTTANCGTYHVRVPCTELGANFPTSWLLDSVIFPSGKSIHYIYSNDLYVEDKWVSQTYRRTMSQSIGQTETCSTSTNYYNKLLTKIDFGNHSIEYYYSYKNNNKTELGSKLDRFVLSYKGNKAEEFVFSYHLNSYNRLFLMEIHRNSKVNTNQLYRRFEYYDKDNLPNKNSFAIDHFGFLNSYSNPHDNRISGRVIPNEDTYVDTDILTDGIDRSLDPSKITTGSLRKIYYPTKGYTHFEYEPNMAFVNRNFLNERSFSFSKIPSNTPLGWQTHYTDFFPVETASYDNYIVFNSLFVTLFNETNDPGLNWQRPTFDLLNESNQILYSRTLVHQGENIDEQVEFEGIGNLPPGNYRFRISVFNSDPNLSLPYTYSVRIRGTTFFDDYIGNQYYGGLRIQKISNYTADNTLANQREYHYDRFDEEGISSGIKGSTLSTSRDFNVANYDRIVGCHAQNTSRSDDFSVIAVSSNPVLSDYVLGVPVRYSNVKETFNGNEKFTIKRYYENFGRVIPPTITNNILVRPKSVEDFALGILVQEDLMDAKGNIVKKKEIEYNTLPPLSLGVNATLAHATRRVWVGGIFDGLICEYKVSQSEYFILTRWFVQKKITNTIYNATDTIETYTENFYENSDHKMLTRTVTLNSKGELLETKTYYPHDLNITPLINEHRIGIPVKTETFKQIGIDPKEKYSTENTTFDYKSGNYLPCIVQTSKGNNPLEDRVMYHKYDTYRNPLEVSKMDGAHIMYVWGYDDTQPIAKIENASYANLTLAQQNAITAIKIASDNDIDASSESNLRIKLESLRNVFVGSMVTTYTYDPLIGITSMTDPRGYTIYYEYDEFNRLKEVKDADGNLVSDYKYNYKDQ